jgi:phosphoribosylanthranilate isomerase
MRVKICCIESVAEAQLAIKYGTDVIGLVSSMPSGPGVIDEETIAQIAQSVHGQTETFLLTSRTDATEIIAQHQRCQTTAIQLTDAVTIDTYTHLRDALPHTTLVQVLHVTSKETLHEAQRIAPHVDALLLDSGNPLSPVKTLGGTGRVHDWNVSAEIVASVDVPVWLAGGLRAHNVQEAMERVRPHGLDICTGVRTDGKLDREKLQTFFSLVRNL